MEYKKKSRVRNMNDYVNNLDASAQKEKADTREIPVEENSNSAIARTVYPSSGRVVSASRYAGAAYLPQTDNDYQMPSDDLPDNYSRDRQAAAEISEAYARRAAAISAEAGTTQAWSAAGYSRAKKESDAPSRTTRTITPKKSSQATPVRKASSGKVSKEPESGNIERQPAKSSAEKSKNSAPVNQEIKKKPNTRTTAANRKYSDIVDERHNKRAAEAVPEPEKEKKHVFRTLVIIYSVLLLIILAGGLVLLATYLKYFEDSQPNKVAESIVANYGTTARLTSFIQSNSDKIDCIDDLDDFIASYTKYVEGKKISYVEKSSSTAENPAYNLVTGGTIVGSFTLKKTGTGRFNTDAWGLDSYDIVTSFPLGNTLSIYVPQGSTVQVNDTVLDSSYISSSGVPEILQNSVSFMKSAPLFDSYTVSVLTDSPQVTATGSDGKTLDLTQTRSDNTISYVAGGDTSADFQTSVEDLVTRAIEVWGLYFIHMDDTLDYYIMEGTDLYASIFGSEDMDPILTWLYNFEEIEDYDFEYINSSNYQRFTDDCFTVDISYKLDIEFTEAGMSDDNQKLDATWVWVADGDSWSITDIIYK